MARRRAFNAYRDGLIHICAQMCRTCIYRPDSPEFLAPVKARAVKDNVAVICHSTIGNPNQAVCFGFWKHDRTPLLELGAAMDVLAFVPPPDRGK